MFVTVLRPIASFGRTSSTRNRRAARATSESTAVLIPGAIAPPTNIQSGVIYGYAGLIDGLVERMKAELGGPPKVIATGGLVSLIADVARSIQHVDEHLRLEGLRLIYEAAYPA